MKVYTITTINEWRSENKDNTLHTYKEVTNYEFVNIDLLNEKGFYSGRVIKN